MGSSTRLAALLGALFVALALVVEIRGEMPGDEWILTELTNVFGSQTEDAMVAVGEATDTVPFLIIGSGAAAAVLLATDHRRSAATFVLVVAVVMIGNSALKQLFARPRPEVSASQTTESTFGFPSGHAANTLAIVVGLVLIVPRTWRRTVVVVGGLLVALVGFSRLVIGVHYPSDLLAAWLWVGAYGTVIWTLRRRDAPVDTPS